MDYKVIIQATISVAEDEVIGAKESITDALEIMGCTVDYVNVMPAEVEK